MTSPSAKTTTRLLNRLGAGDRSVEEELLSSVYDELRRLARVHMRPSDRGHTLQPTALAHEAWLRLVRVEELDFDGREQFFRLASKTMRSVLVDHHRMASAEKRGGGREAITLVEVGDRLLADGEPTVDLIALDDALQRLEQHDEELARLVELRFFTGLSHPEISAMTGTPLRSVERQWSLARAWLHGELSK